MKKAITQNDLLLLAYNELPPERSEQIFHEISKNKDLLLEFQNIRSQMNVLDSVSFKPNPTSIQIVLEESCSSSSLETI